ncbi:inositol monophosphatase family protein [Halalkalibacter akibai]|uniref:Inositol-1-monophosphatase n=1 Tax=Halalkalibacter akibai (strain ATCC 43226 / DSM 21942 / CIP 109018 / JCM 9157 / 1139) TaxID=1236973 RepID=W4QZJ6_HALA3|nr:inositol monophosphatase family protein [Halalkalibacter akibai]GAE37332.1 inositol-1-monophosphatase [Halalkalibacter akibai JCM 9157]
MENKDLKELYETARKWTLEAGERIKHSLTDTIEVEYKTSAADLVTQKDKEIEQFFIERILNEYPDHHILGEEGMSETTPADYQQGTVWIIDPIDGTTNFVHQKRNFAISVAIYRDGSPLIGCIYDPIEEELFHGCKDNGAFLNDEKLPVLTSCSVEEAVISFNHLWVVPNEKVDYEKMQQIVLDVRGVRSIGSAALEIAYVACGRLDAYLDFRLSAWDIAAGIVILNELAGISTTMEQEDVDVFNLSSTIFIRPGLDEKLTSYLL